MAAALRRRRQPLPDPPPPPTAPPKSTEQLQQEVLRCCSAWQACHHPDERPISINGFRPPCNNHMQRCSHLQHLVSHHIAAFQPQLAAECWHGMQAHCYRCQPWCRNTRDRPAHRIVTLANCRRGCGGGGLTGSRGHAAPTRPPTATPSRGGPVQEAQAGDAPYCDTTMCCVRRTWVQPQRMPDSGTPIKILMCKAATSSRDGGSWPCCAGRTGRRQGSVPTTSTGSAETWTPGADIGGITRVRSTFCAVTSGTVSLFVA